MVVRWLRRRRVVQPCSGMSGPGHTCGAYAATSNRKWPQVAEGLHVATKVPRSRIETELSSPAGGDHVESERLETSRQEPRDTVAAGI